MDRVHRCGSSPGKLKGAAARWARDYSGAADRTKPAALTDDTRSDFIKLGVKPSALPTPARPEYFPVWPENWAALLFFLGLHTQWRSHLGMKGLLYLGLDYTAVESLMRIEAVKNRKAMMADLKVMEATALVILNGGNIEEPAWQS